MVIHVFQFDLQLPGLLCVRLHKFGTAQVDGQDNSLALVIRLLQLLRTNVQQSKITSARKETNVKVLLYKQQQYLQLFDAHLNCPDVRAEVQPALLLQFIFRLPEPHPNIVQVGVQLLPLLLTLLCADLFAEVLSLQELPAFNHPWRAECKKVGGDENAG